MKRIKTKLILAFSALILVITMVIGFISLESGYKALKKEAQNSLKLLAAESAKLTESRMETVSAALELIAKKQEIVDMGWQVNVDVLKEELKKTSFLDIGYILPNGYANYTDGTVSLMSDRSYVKEALKGKSTMSDVIISRVTRKPEIEICVPVMKAGTVLGAVIARKEADTLGEITKDSGYGETGYAFIINGKGRIIAAPDTDKVLKLYNPIELVKNDKSLTSLAGAHQIMLNKKSGVVSFHQDNTSFYAGFAPIVGTDWIFAITANQSEIFYAIPKLVRSIIIVMAVVFSLSIGLIYVLESTITRPLIGITKISEKIAALDLRENISKNFLKQKDEIGILSGTFQSLTDKLREIIISISSFANQVTASAQELTASSLQSASTSKQISETIDYIALDAVKQAESTELGFSNAEKLGEMIELNNEYVNHLNLTTEKVNLMVKNGLKDVEWLSNSANENRKATEEICDIILQTKNSSNQISEASRLISEMARQINLLALNASIEAARAGEAGTGFAVVAAEIQKIAEESATSTKYIDKTIEKLTQNVKASSKSMERIRQTSEEQYKSVAETIHNYEVIAEAMKTSEVAVSKLNLSEKDMKRAKDEILLLLQSLSAIATENASGTQQAKASIEEQTVMAKTLADTSSELSELACHLQLILDRVLV